MEGQKKGKIAGGLADPEEFVEEFGGEEKWREGLEREERGAQGGVEEIEYEQGQEEHEQYEQGREEQYEQQEEEQYEPEQHELNGVEGGVADLHLGAEQPEEEEEHYVPHEAQEGLREFSAALSPLRTPNRQADPPRFLLLSRADTRSLHQRRTAAAAGRR